MGEPLASSGLLNEHRTRQKSVIDKIVKSTDEQKKPGDSRRFRRSFPCER